MSDGFRDAFRFGVGTYSTSATPTGMGVPQSQGGPWDLTDPDDTQEILFDDDWFKEFLEDLNGQEEKRVKAQCVCGSKKTKDWNLHAYWCPAYRPYK